MYIFFFWIVFQVAEMRKKCVKKKGAAGIGWATAQLVPDPMEIVS